MWEVVGQGVICIAIAVACAAFAVRGVVPGLMAVLVVVATYGAFKTFVSKAYPRTITISEECISFESLGRTDSYRLKDVHDIRVREYPSELRMYVRMDNDGFLRGRYWVHAQWFSDGEELFSRVCELEDRLNPNTLKARVRRGGASSQGASGRGKKP